MKVFAALGLACALVGAAFAQSTSTQEFVTKVAISDMFEVQSGKLASERGNAEVKAFGQKMVKDHTKTTSELKGLVGKAKAKLPTAMDAEHKTKLSQLQRLKGDEFNGAYLSAQLQAHEEAVKLFEGYSKNGEEAQLRAWAAKTLPNLRDHLEHARKLAKDSRNLTKDK
jgi:putative membrane protein